MAFIRIQESSINKAVLYESDDNTASNTWCGYLLSDQDKPPATIEVQNSWDDYDGSPRDGKNGGCYIFCPDKPGQNFLDNLCTYITHLNKQFNNYAYRYLFWFNNEENLTDVDNSYIAFAAQDNVRTVTQRSMLNFKNIHVDLDAGVELSLEQDKTTQGYYIELKQFNKLITMDSHLDTVINFGKVSGNLILPITPGQPQDVPTVSVGTVCFPFDLMVANVDTNNDFNIMRVGLTYFYTKDMTLMSHLYKILYPPVHNKTFTVTANLHPLYPLDTGKTCFQFTDTGALPEFTTSLTTDYGHLVNLSPIAGKAGLAFAYDKTQAHNGTLIDTYYTVLYGQFAISVPDNNDQENHLLCGLSGIETISLPAGKSIMTFYPGQAAYAPCFPLKTASIMDGNDSKDMVLLDTTYTTTWVTVTAVDDTTKYFSQPSDAALYTQDESKGESSEYLIFNRTMVKVINQDDAAYAFPLVPYSLVELVPVSGDFTMDALCTFEREIISAVRKARISAFTTALVDTTPTSYTTKPSTTPQGLIARIYQEGTTGTGMPITSSVDLTGRWAELDLAQNLSEDCEMKFTGLDSALQSAFQTNNLFLVTTENTNLGWLLSTLRDKQIEALKETDPVFYNIMKIQEWTFDINTGINNTYGNYTNVLLFKFCKGTVKDLVKKPDSWSQKNDFNNADETTAISQWLQDYITDAEQKVEQADTNPAYSVLAGFYKNFVSIVNDEHWNGILALQVDIDVKHLPQELEGIVAGIDISRFNAHHLGVRVNYVTAKSGIAMDSTSSMFGMISYVDTAYQQSIEGGASADTPVPPTNSGPYDFKILTLQVLFENTAIKDFYSKVQLTMNELFSDTVTKITSSSGQAKYNTMVLNGTYQDHNGSSIYVFDNTDDTIFYFNSNILGSIELAGVQFNTAKNTDDTDDPDIVQSTFSLQGFLNFSKAAGLDAFSFGSESGGVGDHQGLGFSGLTIDMQFNITTPTVTTFAFDADHITCNVADSTPRLLSLYPNFALELSGLISGNDDNPPESKGYLTTSTPGAAFSGVSGTWYGLTMTLNMGTPGALASAAGFTASLLVAWSPGSATDDTSYNAFVGLKLPCTGSNAKLLSLQGVLKLAIDSIELTYVKATQSYLLKLDNIALKFLGIVKLPPGGDTCFYLFGNPAKDAGSSSLGWYAAYNKDVANDNENKGAVR